MSCFCDESSFSKMSIILDASDPGLSWASMAFKRSLVRPSWRKNARWPIP